MIPWLFSLIYILNLSPIPGLNLIPISFLFTGLLILVAFYAYKFLHLVPIARDKLLEVMWDGMIVTDADEDICAFKERENESTISFESVLKDLKSDGKI